LIEKIIWRFEIKGLFYFLGLLHTDLEEKMEIHFSAMLINEEDCVKS